MKSFFSLLLVVGLLGFVSISTAQNYNISNGSVSTCAGTFYDNGGSGSNYSSNATYTYTICSPTVGQNVQVKFNSFDIENTYDFLSIYNGGTPTAGNLIIKGSGTSLNGQTFQGTSVDGCLTFIFTSDGSTTKPGWAASISCFTPCPISNAVVDLVGGTSPLEVCKGETINFSGTNSVPASGTTLVSYTWNFDDGTTSVGTTASHSFSQSGFYDVKLTVVDNSGCSSTSVAPAKILVGTPTFYTGSFLTPNSICLGDSATMFIQTRTPKLTDPPVYDGGTVALPDIEGQCFTSSLFFDDFANGATITSINDLKNVSIKLEHSWAGDITIDVICPNGQSVGLFNSDGTWNTTNISSEDFGNPSVTPTVGFNYTWSMSGIQTIDQWGQNSTATTIPVGTYKPEESFGNLVGCPLNGSWQLKVCDTHTVDDGTVFNWSLNFDPSLYVNGVIFPTKVDSGFTVTPAGLVSSSGNTTILSPSVAGTYSYTYQIEDSYGCSYDTTLVLTVNNIPVATLLDTAICAGYSATLSPVVVPSASTYSWFPGNSTGPAFTVSPLTTTSYTVIVKNGNNCSDTAFATVTVNNSPQALFNFNRVCEGDITNFTNVSTINAPSTIVAYSWDLNDGSVSNAFSFSHLYGSSGTYNVGLIAVSSEGCVDSVYNSVIVDGNPVNQYIISDTVICSYQSIGYDYTGVIASGTNITWNFGIGTSEGTAPVPDTSHLYTTPGLYTVVVSAVSAQNCLDSDTLMVNILPRPQVDFSFNNACMGDTVSLVDQSASANSTLVAWSWTLDSINANTSTLQNPAVVYGTDTVYLVKLLVTDANGCTDSAYHPVEVYSLPVADFVVTNQCKNVPVDFLNQTTIKGNGALTFSWDFETDGIMDGSQPSPQFLYLTDSTYLATLYVSSINGCKDSVAKNVIVYPLPVASFVADTLEGCEPLTVKFTPDSLIKNSSFISGYQWYYNAVFSDSSHYANPTFSAGVYDVKLVVQSGFGCKDSIELQDYITANSLPKAEFVYEPVLPSILSPVVEFKDVSTGIIDSWSWSLGDSVNASTSLVKDGYAQYTYPDSGNYCVKLFVGNNKGCYDTVTNCIYVKGDYAIYIPNTFTPGNDQLNEVFLPKGIGVQFTKGFDFRIYDRWGNEVFLSNDLLKGWDGKNKTGGKLCPPDVYVYRLALKDIFNRDHLYNGTINLVR